MYFSVTEDGYKRTKRKNCVSQMYTRGPQWNQNTDRVQRNIIIQFSIHSDLSTLTSRRRSLALGTALLNKVVAENWRPSSKFWRESSPGSLNVGSVVECVHSREIQPIFFLPQIQSIPVETVSW